jgi:hypothetical protein
VTARVSNRRKATTDMLAVVFLGVAPPVMLVTMMVFAAHFGHAAFDFKYAFWYAGTHVLHGASPYPPATHAVLASKHAFVYPAPTALLFAPFALLPYPVAAALFIGALVTCGLAAPWVLGVRDWRCYGAMLLSAPVVGSVQTAAISLPLALLLALAWRWRTRAVAVGSLLGAAVVAKVFLWPLLAWPLVRGRHRAVAVAVGGGLAVTALAWAAIGFAGLRGYPHLLLGLSDVEQATSYSPLALALSAGAPLWLARLLTVVGGGALLAFAARAARRPDGDRRALTACIAAALVLSPIVWLHYLVLLFVPVAILRPRLSWPWLVPVLLWVTPYEQSFGTPARIVAALAVATAMLVPCLRPVSPAAAVARLRPRRAEHAAEAA